MSGWARHPGLYRLFELGHVVAADGLREYMFESAGTDSTGASLVAVYSKTPALTPSEVLEDRTAEVAALMKARAVGPR